MSWEPGKNQERNILFEWADHGEGKSREDYEEEITPVYLASDKTESHAWLGAP